MLGGEQLRVHANDQDLLIIGAIEYADPAPLWQTTGRVPQKVVRQLRGAGLFETENLAALRIDAGHDVLDGPILSARIHPLQDQQQRMPVVRIEEELRRAELLDA